jgi:kynureninase
MSHPGTQEPAEQADVHIAEPSAESDTVNAQVTDAVAFVDAASAGGAAEVAEGSLSQIIAQAAGLALLNAVNAQQQAYVTANATVLATVARILGAPPPAPQDSKPEGAKRNG